MLRYAIAAYAIVMFLLLALRPAPAAKGPECGPGVLCIRTQKQVQTALGQGVVPPLKGLSQ